ncbi:MAG TPA: TRAP transporter small permease [Burkholderiaceae bacterium]|nr:TRAP transporter small permease [Burkholderiaceae bacterium]
MSAFGAVNARLSRWAMYLACLALAGLLIVVVYGVIQRYVFNAAPPYVEQVALLLVISVTMFGAAAGVRDAGHIGLDSLVALLSARMQFWCAVAANALGIVFGIALLAGSAEMALSTHGSTIPTLGLSEAWRYAPVFAGGVLIALFSFEHLIARFTRTEVLRSWH